MALVEDLVALSVAARRFVDARADMYAADAKLEGVLARFGEHAEAMRLVVYTGLGVPVDLVETTAPEQPAEEPVGPTPSLEPAELLEPAAQEDPEPANVTAMADTWMPLAEYAAARGITVAMVDKACKARRIPAQARTSDSRINAVVADRHAVRGDDGAILGFAADPESPTGLESAAIDWNRKARAERQESQAADDLWEPVREYADRMNLPVINIMTAKRLGRLPKDAVTEDKRINVAMAERHLVRSALGEALGFAADPANPTREERYLFDEVEKGLTRAASEAVSA